jgi:hypothetical protein
MDLVDKLIRVRFPLSEDPEEILLSFNRWNWNGNRTQILRIDVELSGRRPSSTIDFRAPLCAVEKVRKIFRKDSGPVQPNAYQVGSEGESIVGARCLKYSTSAHKITTSVGSDE